jgi:hypothetical protein
VDDIFDAPPSVKEPVDAPAAGPAQEAAREAAEPAPKAARARRRKLEAGTPEPGAPEPVEAAKAEPAAPAAEPVVTASESAPEPAATAAAKVEAAPADEAEKAAPAGAGRVVETTARDPSRLPAPFLPPLTGPLLPRVRGTMRNWVDLATEARAAVVFLRERYPGTGLLGLAESALRHELDRLRRDYHGGRPFTSPTLASAPSTPAAAEPLRA